MNTGTRILRLDASANPVESTSRTLGDQLLARIQQRFPATQLRHRDLNLGAQFIDARWIAANLGNGATAGHPLVHSDKLIDELKWADHLLLTTPMYNFGAPATLKAWIDQVCRAGITFRYTATGPVGLLEGKRADIVITTGGVPLGSPADFLSGYLRQVFSFIGIDRVNIIGADRMNVDADASIEKAQTEINSLYPASAA